MRAFLICLAAAVAVFAIVPETHWSCIESFALVDVLIFVVFGRDLTNWYNAVNHWLGR